MQDAGFAAAPWAELPPGPESHFRLHLYGVLARMLAQLDTLAQAGDPGMPWAELRFLDGYRSVLTAGQPADLPASAAAAWWDAYLAGWEASTAAHLPLRALAEQAGLSHDDLRVLVTAGLVEEDIRFGALFAALQAPLAARRPCIGVLGWLLAEPGQPPADAWPACRTLLDLGLLSADNRADPRAEWVLRVPPAIWDALAGRPAVRPAPGLERQPAAGFPAPSALILPDALAGQVARMPDLLADGQVRTVVLRGMNGSGRRTVLGTIARGLNRDVILWQGSALGDETWRLLGPLTALSGAMPVLRCDPAPGEALELPDLPAYTGPVGVTLGRAGGLRGPLTASAISFSLPPPDRTARRRFWQAAGLPVTPATVDEITERFLLTGGHIVRAAATAKSYAALAGRGAVTVADVHEATRALNRQTLETLATVLEPAKGWSDLVVSETTARELRALEGRCRAREQLRDVAGPTLGGGLNRGVRALFSGPTGTGKTLAARVIAAALEMDVYRVDLAAVVNKYIGETERNLNQALSRAEELGVVLLLDEGDALMTRRTDVRNSNDRYANLETNYLLQRLESYEGIAIITTNASQRIDEAFLRRLDVIVDFQPPEANERWLIWQSHLAQPNAVSPALLEDVAARCSLTGGQIRNAALAATLLAINDGGRVTDAHLEVALQHEYRRAGAAYPLRSARSNTGQVDRLRRLAAGLG